MNTIQKKILMVGVVLIALRLFLPVTIFYDKYINGQIRKSCISYFYPLWNDCSVKRFGYYYNPYKYKKTDYVNTIFQVFALGAVMWVLFKTKEDKTKVIKTEKEKYKNKS